MFSKVIAMLKAMSAIRSPRAARVAAVALPMLVVAACGGSGGSTNSNSNDPIPANPAVSLIGTDNKFDAKTYSATAGPIGFAYYNKGNVTHSLVIKDGAGVRYGKRLFLTPGKEAGMTVDLAAGTYELYCDVPGHKDAGMDATLTVG